MGANGKVTAASTGGILIVKMENPPANALSEEVLRGLEQSFQRASSDDVAAVVLAGSGCFSAGADLVHLIKHDAEQNARYFDWLYRVLQAVENCPHPVLAVISGYALGAGFELALCADLRVMEETARVGATGVNLGLVFCTQRLPRLIGVSRAREMLMTGRHINPVEAERMGLVHYVCPDGCGLQTARRLANLIGEKSGEGETRVKRVMSQSRDLALDDGLELERLELQMALTSQAFKERLEGFFAQRETKRH